MISLFLKFYTTAFVSKWQHHDYVKQMQWTHLCPLDGNMLAYLGIVHRKI